MDNFDFKKYLANNPLTEAYTPGSGWTEDFEYDDMMAHGLTLTADDSIEDLRKVAEDFTDVNYHREAAHLYDAIDAIEAGDRGEAKMYINKFRKEIKATLSGWGDVNEAQEDKFDIETTEKIAQAIADEFTAEDRELDLKYVVTPGTEESSFDLDVEAGPNTPGPEWKDKNGFGIENYLGDYAGGSFYIKDRIVYNAASRNAKVAYITPEGEIEIISAEDSKADLGMTDDVETDYMERRKEMSDYMEEGKEEEIKETKSNKMKKSELKEMIKSAFLNEKETFDQAFDRIDSEEEVFPGEKPMKEAEEEDVELEDTEEIDVDTDTETADAGEVDVEADAEVSMTGDTKEVQDNLEAALEAAKALGDQKLVDQIGNSITFFTRTHVVGKKDVAEGDIDVEVNNPSEEAEVGMELNESFNRMQKLAGLIK